MKTKKKLLTTWVVSEFHWSSPPTTSENYHVFLKEKFLFVSFSYEMKVSFWADKPQAKCFVSKNILNPSDIVGV